MTKLEICTNCEEAISVDLEAKTVDCRVGKACCGGSLSRSVVNIELGKCNRNYWGVDLREFFERVYVISLKRRPDRLNDFNERIKKANWPHKQPTLFKAIDGDKVGTPAGYITRDGELKNKWGAGGGAWGCMQSHRRILEDCLMDDVKSVLILEDDAEPVKDYDSKIKDFLEAVPKDWDCLMLGGQHFKGGEIWEKKPGVFVRKCTDCQRTHAYAVRGKCMKELYRMWQSYDWHCDHALGPFMAQYNTYSPEPFLIGQGRNKSDITCKMEPARFWSVGTDRTAKVAIIKAPKDVIQSLRTYGLHTGYTRHPQSDIDVGLIKIAESKDSLAVRKRMFREWLGLVRYEAAAFSLELCGIWYPDMSPELRQIIHSCIGSELIQINASSPEQFLLQWELYVKSPTPRAG